MGGMIGQALALEAPRRLLSLALCNTMSELPEGADAMWAERIAIARDRGMAALVEPTLARWFTAAYLEQGSATLDSVAAMIAATPVEGFAGCCQAVRGLDFGARLSAIRLPTLIVAGAEDQATPVARSDDMHKRIPGSRLEVPPWT